MEKMAKAKKAVCEALEAMEEADNGSMSERGRYRDGMSYRRGGGRYRDYDEMDSRYDYR